MAPVLEKREACTSPFNISIDRNSSAEFGANNYPDEDKHALLYIVCTLLFYSLGMIIGIVSYIRREKQDIEQDRMFNEFLTSFRGKTEEVHYRQLKVQETVERLAELERAENYRNNSFGEFDLCKQYSDGRCVAERPNLLKFANLSLLTAPAVVVLSSMTSEASCNAASTGMDSPDPFQNRRLSELVAHILDSDDIEDSSNETSEDFERIKSETRFDSGLIEYCKEPRNKELHRESMQSIEESESDSILAVDNISTVGSSKSDVISHRNSSSKSPSNENFSIETTYGTSIETVFGVNLPEDNNEYETGVERSIETDIVFQSETDDKRVKWSVTSV